MGWLSDKLFGKKKRLNFKKINEYYKPYTSIMNQQGQIAQDMLNPNSALNRLRQDFLRNQQSNIVAQQNQGMLKFGAMSGMSPGQILANTQANNASARGNLGVQFNQLLFDQYDRGLGLLGNVGQQQLGEASRLSGQDMAQVNAHNARRNARMGTFTNLLGMGMQARYG